MPSDNVGLLAPALTNGTSTTVNIAGNFHNDLVTAQRAIWKFNNANALFPPAGTHDGEVTYTASTPQKSV